MSVVRSTARRSPTSALLALSLAPVLPAPAIAQDADSTSSSRPLFTYRDAILAGAFAVTARLVHPLDDHYRDRLQDSSTQANREAPDTRHLRAHHGDAGLVHHRRRDVRRRPAREEPEARVARPARHRGALVGEGVAGVVKVLVGRQRP